MSFDVLSGFDSLAFDLGEPAPVAPVVSTSGESYNRVPVGKIVVRGTPIAQIEKQLLEPAYPGMLVTCDGNDYLCKKLAANTNPVGWLSYEQTDLKVRPTDYNTAYGPGDKVMTVAGGNFEIFALITGESASGVDFTVNIGDLLASNDDGTLKPASSTDKPLCMAMESKLIPKSSGAVGDVFRIHVKSFI